MYDQSIARFERIRFLDGAFVIAILPNDNILLTRQTQPGRSEFLSLPGGSFDFPEENPLLCAKRELLEETGYESNEWTLWTRFDGTNNIMTYTYFYIARDIVKVREKQEDPGERIETLEVTFDQFITLARDPAFHHHWNLLPFLYEALISPEKYDELKKIFYTL
jgi:ADP-ribose pyrophosphatase